MSKNNLCIGLFGTCANSEWRLEFKNIYSLHGYDYFDPVKTNWTENDAVIEAHHLANDAVIIFVITDETSAYGSLVEAGFAVAQAAINPTRSFIFYVEDKFQTAITDKDYVESKRVRSLVKEHLAKIKLPNVFAAQTLSEALVLSLKLYQMAELNSNLDNYRSN